MEAAKLTNFYMVLVLLLCYNLIWLCANLFTQLFKVFRFPPF